MSIEDLTFSSDFLLNINIKASYLVNIPSEGILRREIVECLEWNFLSDKIIKKWDWYFKYRAALLQIKYPKYDIEIKRETVDVKTKEQKQHLLQGKISSKKRKVTEFSNKMKNMKIKHTGLFPVEDDPEYISYQQTLEKKQNELNKLNTELKILNDYDSNNSTDNSK